MASITINTQDPVLIAQLEELRQRAQAKQKKSPARLEKLKKRKFVTASKSIAKTMCDLHDKFDTKMTGKHEEKNIVQVEGYGYYEVTIAVRRRTQKAVEPGAAAHAVTLTSEVKAGVTKALKGLNQKVALPKKDFQDVLATVQGYDSAMWDEVKALLEKDPKSKGGRGTKFFPKFAKAKKSK